MRSHWVILYFLKCTVTWDSRPICCTPVVVMGQRQRDRGLKLVYMYMPLASYSALSDNDNKKLYNLNVVLSTMKMR